MPARGGRPHEGGSVRTWTHVGAAPGTEWLGWIAGDAIGVRCHVGDDPSSACLRHYLGQQTGCARCAKHHRLEWLWYQPIWRESDWKPVVVIFHEDQLDVLDRLKVLQQVTVGRGKEKKSGMFVRPILRGAKFETSMDWKRKPQCIADFLPSLWKMRGLLTGELLLSGGSGVVAVLPPVVEEIAASPHDDAIEPLLDRQPHRPRGDAMAKADELLDLTVESLRKKFPVRPPAGTNGTH